MQRPGLWLMYAQFGSRGGFQVLCRPNSSVLFYVDSAGVENSQGLHMDSPNPCDGK